MGLAEAFAKLNSHMEKIQKVGMIRQKLKAKYEKQRIPSVGYKVSLISRSHDFEGQES
jgi:hypothetical protein